MTSLEMKKLVSTIDLTGNPLPMRFKAEDGEAGSVVLTLDVLVHDRDNPHKGINPVVRKKTLDAAALSKMSSHEAVKFVREMAVDAAVHELDEFFLVDGVRIFDPHAHEVPA